MDKFTAPLIFIVSAAAAYFVERFWVSKAPQYRFFLRAVTWTIAVMSGFFTVVLWTSKRH